MSHAWRSVCERYRCFRNKAGNNSLVNYCSTISLANSLVLFSVIGFDLLGQIICIIARIMTGSYIRTFILDIQNPTLLINNRHPILWLHCYTYIFELSLFFVNIFFLSCVAKNILITWEHLNYNPEYILIIFFPVICFALDIPFKSLVNFNL